MAASDPFNVVWAMTARIAATILRRDRSQVVTIESRLLGRNLRQEPVFVFLVTDNTDTILAGPYHVVGDAFKATDALCAGVVRCQVETRHSST